MARGNLELAREQLAVSASWLQASLSTGYSREQTSVTLEENRTTETSGDVDPISLNATLNVVPYGPWAERVQRQRWALTRAERALRDARSDALVDITQGFQNALRGEEQVEVARAELEFTRMQLEATTVRRDVGAATNSQVLEAELGVQQAQQDLLSAERALSQALASLSVTLGQTVTSVSDGLPEVPADNALSTDYEIQLRQRSDVTDADLNVLEAELTAEATLRENLPSGSVSAGYRTGNEDSSFQAGAQYSVGGPNAYQPTFSLSYDPDSGLPNLSAGSSQSVSVGLNVTVPLDVRLPNALRAARLSVEQARLSAEQTLTLARLEISNRADEVTGARASLELARTILQERQRTLETTQQRFDLGLVSQLEVAQAELNLAEAGLNLHRAEDALRLAYMSYAAALALSPLEVF